MSHNKTADDASESKLLKPFNTLLFQSIRFSHVVGDVENRTRFLKDRLAACNGSFEIRGENLVALSTDKTQPRKRKLVDDRVFWALLTGVRHVDDKTAVFSYKFEHSAMLRVAVDDFLFNVYELASFLYVCPYKLLILKRFLPVNHEITLTFTPTVCKNMNNVALQLGGVLMQCVRFLDVKPENFQSECDRLCHFLHAKSGVFDDTLSFCVTLMRFDKFLNHEAFQAVVKEFPVSDLRPGSFVAWDRKDRMFRITEDVPLPVSQHLCAIWSQVRPVAGDATAAAGAASTEELHGRTPPVGYVQTLQGVNEKLDKVLTQLLPAARVGADEATAAAPFVLDYERNERDWRQRVSLLQNKLQRVEQQKSDLQHQVALLCRQNTELKNAQCNVPTRSSAYRTWCRERMQHLVQQEFKIQKMCRDFSARVAQARGRQVREEGTQTTGPQQVADTRATMCDARLRTELSWCIAELYKSRAEVCEITRSASYDISHMQKLSQALRMPLNAAVTMNNNNNNDTILPDISSSANVTAREMSVGAVSEWDSAQEGSDLNMIVASPNNTFEQNIWT